MSFLGQLLSPGWEASGKLCKLEKSTVVVPPILRVLRHGVSGLQPMLQALCPQLLLSLVGLAPMSGLHHVGAVTAGLHVLVVELA